MSEWAARLGIVFPDKARAEFDQFLEEVKVEQVEYLSLTKDFDELKETKPTYEQISQERILDEANKNLQVLKSLETILQERTQSYGTFFAAQGKYKPSFEIFQYCEGTLRQALDALFVFLEQELQQARQQQTLGDLRKALSEVKVDAQRRLSDYLREVAGAEKEVAAAEKKLSKSKELLEKAMEQKHKLESGDHDTGPSPRRPLAITRYHTQRGDINKQEKIRECLESIAKSDREIREGVQNLLKALGARDQVIVASRRAYQKLDKDCKKTVALTFRKLIVREREAAAARESVLAKLEGAVDKIDVDADLEDFILEHRQGAEGSVQCCVQALTVLGDLMPQDSHCHSDYHNQSSQSNSHSQGSQGQRGYRYRSPSFESETAIPATSSATPCIPYTPHTAYTPYTPHTPIVTPVPVWDGEDSASAPEDHPSPPSTAPHALSNAPSNAPSGPTSAFNASSSRLNWDGRTDSTRERDRRHAGGYSPSPTPIALAATASATLSYAVTTGLPIAEAFASIVSLCTGAERKKAIEKEEVSSEKIVDHLTKIFYYNSSAASAPSPDQPVQVQPVHVHPMLLQLSPIVVEDRSQSVSHSPTASERQTRVLRHPLDVDSFSGPDSGPELTLTSTGGGDAQLRGDARLGTEGSSQPALVGIEGEGGASDSCAVSGSQEVACDTAHTPHTLHTPQTPQTPQTGNRHTAHTTHAAHSHRVPRGALSRRDSDICPLSTTSAIDISDSTKWLSEAVRTQAGRDAFMVELNMFRSKKVDIGSGFTFLGNVLWNVLDRCKEENDVHSAKVIMMLSQTFYRRCTDSVKNHKGPVSSGHGQGQGKGDMSPGDPPPPSDYYPSPEVTEHTTAMSHWKLEDAKRQGEEVKRKKEDARRQGDAKRAMERDMELDRERERERRIEILRAKIEGGEAGGGAGGGIGEGAGGLSDDTEDTEDPDHSEGAEGDGDEGSGEGDREGGGEGDGECEGEECEGEGDNYRLADRGAGSREYLKGALMSHVIWRDKAFWEQALWQCTVEQLRTIPYEQAWHDIPEEHRGRQVTMVHNVIFSQVMAITHSMIELGCSKKETREFLQRMCVLHGLGERQRQDLLRHLMSR